MRAARCQKLEDLEMGRIVECVAWWIMVAGVLAMLLGVYAAHFAR